MKQQQPNLSDFFAKARSAPPVVSEADIDQLLDKADLHGRQSAPQVSAQTTTPVHSQNNNRKRIVMGSIAALLFGTVISAGIFWFGPESPDRITQAPTVIGISSPNGKQTAPNAADKTAPAESTVAVKAPAQTGMLLAPTEKLNGRGDGTKTDAPADPKKEEKTDEASKIGGDISKELQTLIENYWTDRINDYKARIDGMMSSGNLDELNRLRVRWALTDKEGSPLHMMAMMEANTVNANGDETKIQAGLGNTEDAPHMALPQMEGANGQVHIAFGINADNVNETITDSGSSKTVEKHQAVFIYHDDNAADAADPEGANVKKFNIEVEEGRDLTIEDNGDRKIIIKRQVVTDNPELEGTEIPVMEDGMGMEVENMDMRPLMGMLKMAISADKSESSQIMVAAWKLAEDHRPALDDLKQQVMKDVTDFTALMRRKMADFVAEHGEEIPAEMRDAMTVRLDEKGERDLTDGLIKTLEPIYDIIVEPMIMLYNGSDINGVLTSAIAEPVAGISLEANSTLKQSYPNPASTEATIEYTLQEPSAGTMLRIFDAQGSEVRSLNLGPQSAGAHQERVNVKDLPNGTYLYHLTVGTSRGDQVYSKTMQIAR